MSHCVSLMMKSSKLLSFLGSNLGTESGIFYFLRWYECLGNINFPFWGGGLLIFEFTYFPADCGTAPYDMHSFALNTR